MRYDADSAPDEIEFNGVVYRRMGGKRRYYLSTSKSNVGRKGAKGLHVAIWEYHKGPVPPDHEVHHKDANTFNFDIDNLDCLPTSVHRAMPKINGRERQRENLDRIRPLASVWHRSPEGREWHQKHAVGSLRKARINNHPVVGRGNCVICDEIYDIRNRRRVFCGPVCQSVDANDKRRARRQAGLQPDG